MLQITKDTAVDLIILITDKSNYHYGKIESMLYDKKLIEDTLTEREWKEFLEDTSEETIKMILEYI